jgi:glycosyltransferase involved in cell wall biosynthesis
MNQEPLVSVVVPAHNEEKRIGQLLKSLSDQETDFPFEIIVVDNASSDRTSITAKEAGVRVLFEKQKGYSYPVIRGCREARGEIICITDADVIAPNDWLKKIKGAYGENPDAAAIGGVFYYHDGTKFLNFLLRVIYTISPKLIIAEMNGTNMSFRKMAYEKVGGFASGINLSSETLLARKLRAAGRILIKKDIIVYTSRRRFRSLQSTFKELLQRGINALSIKLRGKVIFNSFEDIR